MPLLLKSLPLSLTTFWHYLVTLPFLAIVAFLLLLSSFLPFVGYFVPGTVAVFCLMVGFRCALAARGHGNSPDFGALLRASLVFCVVNIVATFLIGLIAAALFYVVRFAVPLLGISADNPQHTTIWIGGGTVTIYLILLCIYSSAIAVPMTAAAAAATDRGRTASPIFGLGTGMFSLTFIMLVWMFGGNVFSIFGEVTTIFFMLATALFAAINGKDIPWEWSVDTGKLAGATLFMTWASSWFFATAVLAWEKAVQRIEHDGVAAKEVQRTTSTDIRALREARERAQRGPLGN
jgi:hypothetical protein